MDAKDLRTESSPSERKDGSKYSASGAAQQCNRNKTYQDIGTNPLAKTETAAAVRPCAVIGPDRVLPPPNINDAYLKKGSIEPWPCPDNIYSQLPDYHHKMSSTTNQTRNISPRQTFQENMQRIMVPPSYNSVKNTSDGSNFNHVQDRAMVSKNPKPNMASEAKYCDVPYTVNQLSNEHKSFRESEISVPSVNSSLMRTIPHGWSPNSGNIHAPRTYGAHEVYQYQQYPNCVGSRQPILPMSRRVPTFQEDPGYGYPDSYYQDPNIRFKSYPQVKDRYPQPRFDYVSNYPNPYHPPPTFPPHKYDIPKPGTSHQYPVYPHLKYVDNRGTDPTIEAYQRPLNQPPPGYNMPFRNQVIHPTYPGLGNAQTKVLPYSIDSTGKPIVSNKLPYDSNKIYIDYDNARNKSYTVNDPYFLNEINRIQPAKNQIMPPNYPTASMHHIPNQQFLRKDIHMKSHEFMPHFRNFDPSVGNYTMIRHPSQFSPNTIAISPTDSNTSNDTTQTQGTNQEDCGYVSQSSSASVRSVESSINRMSSEYYKRHEYRYGTIGNTHMVSKHEVKGKKQIDVRQFLQMWNEGDDDNGEHNNKDSIIQTSTNNVKQDNKQEQLYVLGLVNVPNEELSKYEHIQTVSKLPEHIKGYNSIELLKQYEEVVESSNISSFKPPVSKNFHMPGRDHRNTPKQVVEVLPRPISPLDVEAKISQSVIHKEVGCNFEIKPCSPKMLNVEIPAPVQNVLGERVIEKVSNPLSKVTESSISVQTDEDPLHNNMKRQTSLPNYEKSSCKILSSPFTPHNLDSVKTDYSIQDLEINSGVCLASLPRLDNEIELNFPEVNQQFIDANKIDNNTSKEQSEPKQSNTVLELKNSKEKVADSENIQGQNITFSQDDSQKEYTRLNKYRKSNSTERSENTITAIRTDSVIIKNPETLKIFGNSPRNDHSNFIGEEMHVPVNLTSHIDVNNKTKKSVDSERNQDKTETYVAIDFSFNKNDINRANKVSKKSKMRTSKQIDNEKNKLTATYNCFGVPSNDTKTHQKENNFRESNVEARMLNTSSYLPNITNEEIDNLNEYSCKADFDDVMKKLTANDFEMTSEINFESTNNTTNSNDVIENQSRLDINFKAKSDFHPNEQFLVSQPSTKHSHHDAEILTENEKSNQQSIGNKNLHPNELKLEEQIEHKQHQKNIKSSNKDKLPEDYNDALVPQSTEFGKLDTNKLIKDEKNLEAKQLLNIENFSINNLSEKDKTISKEWDKSNIYTSIEENQVILKSRQRKNVNLNTDLLTEETESVDAKQLIETENNGTNRLSEKYKTQECNTFHLDMLIKEEKNTLPQQTENAHFTVIEQNSKEIENIDSNISTEDDQSILLELQIKENNSFTLPDATREQYNTQETKMTLEENTLSERNQNAQPKQQITDSTTDTLTKEKQNTIIEKSSQENMYLQPETLTGRQDQKHLPGTTPLEVIKINTDKEKEHHKQRKDKEKDCLPPANSPLENETSGKDMLFKTAHAMQEQHLKEAHTITENDHNESLDQQLQLVKNNAQDMKMLVELESEEIKVQCGENENIKTVDALAEENQSISQNETLQLSTKNNSFDTEMLVKQQNVSLDQDDQLANNNAQDMKMLAELESEEIKVHCGENENVKTVDALAEEHQSISQNETLQLSTKNNSFDTEMLVEQQNVDMMQHDNNKCDKIDSISEEMLVDQQNLETEKHNEGNTNLKVNALTEERQSTFPKSQSKDDVGIDSVTPTQEEDLNPSQAIQKICLVNEDNSDVCISDNNLNENVNNSPDLLENIPLPDIDSNDLKESGQDYDENDIACNFKLFKRVCGNNYTRCNMKLYSPQIQKLIMHVEGFINSNSSNERSETILGNKTFKEIKTTNNIVDQESRIDKLPNNVEISLEVQTGTEERLEIQSSDSELVSHVSTGSEPIVESVSKKTNTLSVVDTPKSSQDDSQFEFDEICDSTKASLVEPDSNTNYSTDEKDTSLIPIKNLQTSYANEQNIMVNDSTVNTDCEEVNANKLSLLDSDNIVFSQRSDSINCNDSANFGSKITDSDEKKMNDLNDTVKTESESNDIENSHTTVTSEENDTAFVITHDTSLTTPEMNEEKVVYTFDKSMPEAKDSNDIIDSLKGRQSLLKRSLSDSALNAYAQDNNRELNWPIKRRKIDENTLEQNIINESICRLIQASRRNSISTFDNEENVSFCILIDDTCILTEANAQDKICYAEVSESSESDTINQIEDNVVTGSPYPQNDIDIMTTNTMIYECQEDDVENEGTWVEDIACIETVNCENVEEELVINSSPSPKHGFNDTVISENVAEDVVISSPSSIKCFEDDFVHAAPTFNHDWVETLVDDGVAEDVVISSFLTTKDDCLDGEISTNLEETIGNCRPSLKHDWNETEDENISVGSVLIQRESWDKTVDVHIADDAIIDCRSSTNYDCLAARGEISKDRNIPFISSPKNYAIESEVARNIIDPSKHSHSFKRVVKVTDVMITDSPSYSKDHLAYDDNELSCYNLHEHTNKVKSIYGDRMTDGDAQIVDTLFRTPQMDVNKTLLHDSLELDISAKLSHMEYSDDNSSESSHQKSSSCIFSEYSDSLVDNDITNRNAYQKENVVTEKSITHSNESIDIDNSYSEKCKPLDKTVHPCESSVDNVFTYDDSNYTSSSPEVSSTTSEDRNSGILLKITNLNGSRISQINEIKSVRKPRCKFTEKKDYSSNRFPNRPLITKAAQKYIPPVKESIQDLKVKISLPPQSLLKFKELKLSRNVTKVTHKQSSSNIPKIPKKPKPLFEDVLKSIDEIQIKMHREKKKPKTTIPKVVIKKNEYGSHYASTPTKETFNPDLTGRKWQPWVFIERNNFIDNMALKNKSRAVFNHRKKCYVLAEKFKKYKSAVSNTKFVISRPSSIKSTGQLKYTIRLKHSY